MIKQLVNYLKDTFYKNKLVNTVKYQSQILINQQPTNQYYEVSIDDDNIINNNITEGILTIQFNITILGRENDILTAQDNALHIALDVMEYIYNDNKQISIHDYSILALSEYTDDKASGVRLTLELIIPSPINLCEYKDNFDENKKIEEKENELILNDSDECTNSNNQSYSDNKEITLNPIKLF